MGFTSYLFLTVGVFFFLYFLLICRHCGYAPDFSWFWILGGCCFCAAGGFLYIICKIPGFLWIEKLAFLGLILILLIWSIAFGLLKRQGKKKTVEKAEYLIVLGAKVNGYEPSLALKERINTAFTYLKENPETKAVLTGGMGRGEKKTEALAMAEALINKGIEKERLILEEQSTTTLENIAFASRLIDDRKAKIIIVTSDFHTLRGRQIAIDAGFLDVSSLGAKSSKTMSLHYYTRETLSWIKYWFSKI